MLTLGLLYSARGTSSTGRAVADSGELRPEPPAHLRALLEQDGIKIIFLFSRENKERENLPKHRSVESSERHLPRLPLSPARRSKQGETGSQPKATAKAQQSFLPLGASSRVTQDAD